MTDSESDMNAASVAAMADFKSLLETSTAWPVLSSEHNVTIRQSPIQSKGGACVRGQIMFRGVDVWQVKQYLEDESTRVDWDVRLEYCRVLSSITSSDDDNRHSRSGTTVDVVHNVFKSGFFGVAPRDTVVVRRREAQYADREKKSDAHSADLQNMAAYHVVTRSVKWPSCPSRSSHVRAKLNIGGFAAVKIENGGGVEVSFLADIDIRGNISSWIKAKLAKEQPLCLARIHNGMRKYSYVDPNNAMYADAAVGSAGKGVGAGVGAGAVARAGVGAGAGGDDGASRASAKPRGQAWSNKFGDGTSHTNDKPTSFGSRSSTIPWHLIPPNPFAWGLIVIALIIAMICVRGLWDALCVVFGTVDTLPVGSGLVLHTVLLIATVGAFGTNKHNDDADAGDGSGDSAHVNINNGPNAWLEPSNHPAHGTAYDGDVVDKYALLSAIDQALGHSQPPRVEYILVEDTNAPRLEVLSATVMEAIYRLTGKGHSYPLGLGFGHACVRYTLPNGEQRLANITRGLHGVPGRDSLVEFWDPSDYLFGVLNQKGWPPGVHKTNFVSVRVWDVDDAAVIALDLWLKSVLASWRSTGGESVKFDLIHTLKSALSFLIPTRVTTAGNCAHWIGQGLFFAGLLSRTHSCPKAIWTDMFEHYCIDRKQRSRGNDFGKQQHMAGNVVYIHQVDGKQPWHAIVSPFHWLRNWIYWDLTKFADVDVTFERLSRSTTKENVNVNVNVNVNAPVARVQAGPGARPGYIYTMRHFHATAVFVLAVSYLFLGWPTDATDPAMTSLMGRVAIVTVLLVFNSLMY